MYHSDNFLNDVIVLWLRKFKLCAAANDWKDVEILKRTPTPLSGKAFKVFERLAATKKEGCKTSTKSLRLAGRERQTSCEDGILRSN